MRSPSGLKRGCMSYPIPLVRRVASPPVIGIEYRSPSMSKTIVWPSGLTSSEIQVPSLVVNRAQRAGSSGRPRSGSGSASWAWVARGVSSTSGTAQ